MELQRQTQLFLQSQLDLLHTTPLLKGVVRSVHECTQRYGEIVAESGLRKLLSSFALTNLVYSCQSQTDHDDNHNDHCDHHDQRS